ncbi:MAG: succinyl-diaminopimelate desuccinylase [Gammaproteobacteria bacterium]|nr:succinyl-diaminopimelate desuccinylase [Gammaproteobacteria bacterium]
MEHLRQLVHRPSVTPNDAGCQSYISRILNRLGFEIDMFEVNDVTNMIAKIGEGDIRIAFSGHTDVVPANNVQDWTVDPFALTEKDGVIFGRGVADMKGGIAAMLAALEQALPSMDLNSYCFYVLITSDEEGEAEYGTKEIIQRLADNNEVPHMCIVGEPTSAETTGDVIKVGRRGAISGEVLVKGKQGHVAYPKNANNASHKAMALGKWLTELSWDEGSTDFPGSHLQITGLSTGEWTDNIIPGECTINFNVRYSNKQTEDDIKLRISSGLLQLKQLTQDLTIRWSRSCLPYHTSGELIDEVEKSIFDVTQRFPRLSTSGGTSDGRFIAQFGAQVVELGVPNHSIHQVDENVKLKDLLDLQHLYRNLLVRLAS